MTDGQGRWGRLADRRAAALLASAAGPESLVVAAPDAFPCTVAGATTVAPPGLRADVTAGPGTLPVATATRASVIDTTRPEGPDDQPARIRELVRVCRPGGTVAAIACAAAPAAPVSRRWASRSLPLVLGLLADAGCEPVRIVPFDLLGPFSRWRLGLGSRRARVLAELEDHLRAPAVRRAVRWLERAVMPALPPEQAGRALVVARRRAGIAGVAWEAPPALPEVLAAPAFRAAAVRHLQDDAVLRWLAFVDAENLAPAAAPVDVVRWVTALTATAPALRDPGCWRWPGHELQRLLEAASHRLATRTVSALAAGAPDAEGRTLAATMEYDVVETFHRCFERALGGVA